MAQLPKGSKGSDLSGAMIIQYMAMASHLLLTNFWPHSHARFLRQAEDCFNQRLKVQLGEVGLPLVSKMNDLENETHGCFR